MSIHLYDKNKINLIMNEFIKQLSNNKNIKELHVEIYQGNDMVINLDNKINDSQLEVIKFNNYFKMGPRVKIERIEYSKLKEFSFRPFDNDNLNNYLELNRPSSLRLYLEFIPTYKEINKRVEILEIYTKIDYSNILYFIRNFKNVKYFGLDRSDDVWV